MAVISRVNPNFPFPGIDQSSKGFRDNFTIIKSEIEALQGKRIQLVGDVTGGPTLIDSGTGNVVIATTAKSFRLSFNNTNLLGGLLTVTHNLGIQFVLVQVSNNLNQIITPDSITLTNSNSLSINLVSFGIISGTWNVLVRG
jgi:hypothetical protein